jgi:hypothetical protein
VTGVRAIGRVQFAKDALQLGLFGLFREGKRLDRENQRRDALFGVQSTRGRDAGIHRHQQRHLPAALRSQSVDKKYKTDDAVSDNLVQEIESI